MNNIAGLADLRAGTRVRIAANQSAWLPTQVPEVIAQRGADVIVTDPHSLGGLVPFHNALTMCETAGIPVIDAPSATSESRPSPPLRYSRRCRSQVGHQQFLTFLVHDLLAEKVEFVDGNLAVPTGPGLGIRPRPGGVEVL